MSNVNNPSHYNKFPHEVIELSEQFDNNLGNVIKYIIRSPYKNNYHEDMLKAAWYLNRVAVKKQKLRTITKSIIDLATTFQNPLLMEILEAVKKKDYPELEKLASFIKRTSTIPLGGKV